MVAHDEGDIEEEEEEGVEADYEGVLRADVSRSRVQCGAWLTDVKG